MSVSFRARLYFAALVAAILFLSTVTSDPGKIACLVPNDDQLLAQLLSHGGVVLSPPENEGNGKDKDQSSVQDLHDIFKVGQVNPGVTTKDWHCPVGEKPPQDAPVHERASCPWRYIQDHDPTRYPSTVLQAVARCSACLGPGGSPMAGTRCEPITYQTKALRQKGCDQERGRMNYDVEEMKQIVAFQCTFVAGESQR